ncbi:MAG: RNase adapter RapZ [Lachnospiraceae bacterium]|nr:RNase adapter RapZ [Lachnospiraceae bacterium]
MSFVIVTGMSGAGKSTVLNLLEDDGYFCVDNLPVPFLEKFADMTWHEENNISKVAIGIDIRSMKNLSMLDGVLRNMREAGHTYTIIFLDCSDQVLMRRYKETRRSHPLASGGRLGEALVKERQKLEFLREQSDYIIDTTKMKTRDLAAQVRKIFEGAGEERFFINIVSFGYKYGIPEDADIVMDVRFLPNPFYVDELKHRTGNDQQVRDYVLESDDAREFMAKMEDLCAFLIPRYIQEGKTSLVIAVGCTGGKHRSVAIANALCEALKSLHRNMGVEHRDIGRDTRIPE